MWIAIANGFDGYGSVTGAITRMTPEGDVIPMKLPADVSALDEKPSFATFCLNEKSRLHINGGLTDNVMVTEHGHCVRPFIAPMSEEIVVSTTPTDGQIGIELVPATTGLLGQYILYLRWGDKLHSRRSPFSGASPTLVMDGAHAIKLRKVPRRPTPDDRWVDQVEVWGNRNGENLDGRFVYRQLAVRDSGAGTVTITEIAEGAAETADNLQEMPRCKFNLIFHQRLFAWGNEEDPTAVFGSILNRTDEYGGLAIRTLLGDVPIGGVVVRNVMAIFTAKGSYTLLGLSEADYKLDHLDRDIGCITHHGIVMVGEDAIIPTPKGIFLFDGQSLRLISGDYLHLWIEAFKQNPIPFERGFAVNDKTANVYKFYMASDDGVGRVWILDYSTFVPEAGGDLSVPRLSFDRQAKVGTAAANLGVPGSKKTECYTGSAYGEVLRDNVSQADDAGDAIEVVIFPAMVGRHASNEQDGLTLDELWLHISNFGNEPATLDVSIIRGNEFAALIDQPLGGFGCTSQTTAFVLDIPRTNEGKHYTQDVDNPLKLETPEGVGLTLYPTSLIFPKLSLTGEFFAPRIVAISPKRLIFRGWGASLSPGKKYLPAPIND